MPERSHPSLPTPDADQRRMAAENFDRARQVLLTGNYDYGIELLRTSCRLDPGNLLYRQHLRRAQKEKFGNNLRGSRLAFIRSWTTRPKIRKAKASRDYVRLLEYCEDVLTRNPWDLDIQMEMAEAFDALNLSDLAVFSLDQARQKYPKHATLNRALARLFEKRGDYQRAIALWNLVKEVNPQDVEAAHKAKNLAATETINKGGYEEVAAGSKLSPALSAQPKGGSRAGGSGPVNLDKTDEQVELLAKRLEADPTEPLLYIQLAHIHRKLGDEERARAVLRQGLGPTGNHFSLQTELLELDLIPLRRNLESADKQLREYREMPADERDSDDEARLVENRTKLAKELLTQETELYRAKADRQPSDSTLRLELGYRLLRLDRVDEAIAELQQARRDERCKGRAGLYLGQGFRKKGNWRLARRNLEEAIKALPSNDEQHRKEALYQLATGAAEAGELAEAVDFGNELANLDYAYRGINKLLDEWHAKLPGG